MELKQIYRIHVCNVTGLVSIEKWHWSPDSDNLLEYGKWRWLGSMTCRDWHENTYGIKFFSSYEEAVLQCAVHGINVIDNDKWEYLYKNQFNKI